MVESKPCCLFQQDQPEVVYEDKSVTLNLVSTVMMSSFSNGHYSSVLVVSEQAWQVCALQCLSVYQFVYVSDQLSMYPSV